MSAGTLISPKKIDQIFQRFYDQLPNPKGELEYDSPFTLLVAVVLSAQATDKSVNLATRELFKVASTPQQMVELGVERIKLYIKSIGLFNTKAKNIFELSRKIIESWQDQIPTTAKELETLPGVGRKTANVILNTAFGQPTIAVDTHVYRVSHRLGITYGKTPLAVEIDLLKKVPAKWLYEAHHWLILHGRYTCLARKPKCPSCIIQDLCPYLNKTL